MSRNPAVEVDEAQKKGTAGSNLIAIQSINAGLRGLWRARAYTGAELKGLCGTPLR
jgi:hypothetical protein